MVLSHFKSGFHWFIKDNGHLVSRFRWEKLNLHEESWWMPKDPPRRSDPPTTGRVFPVPECQKLQPIIFAQGFVCLEHKCKDFWKLNGKVLTNGDQLSYNPEWLAERTEQPAEKFLPASVRWNQLKARMDNANARKRAIETADLTDDNDTQPSSKAPRSTQPLLNSPVPMHPSQTQRTQSPPSICITPTASATIEHSEQAFGRASILRCGHSSSLRRVAVIRTNPPQPWRVQTSRTGGLASKGPDDADEILAQMANPVLHLEHCDATTDSPGSGIPARELLTQKETKRLSDVQKKVVEDADWLLNMREEEEPEVNNIANHPYLTDRPSQNQQILEIWHRCRDPFSNGLGLWDRPLLKHGTRIPTPSTHTTPNTLTSSTPPHLTSSYPQTTTPSVTTHTSPSSSAAKPTAFGSSSTFTKTASLPYGSSG
ncbi:MAG: hypothetical protein LQ352_001187 [Teloschistes flavicans]|nr:MAG: hypothetical protein LQ352_001187 [Teloschistes flavicans]